MKLIIQIPCLNEAATLPQTLADLPKQIEGIDTIEWLIIDDGSTDDTVQVAREHGVHHIVQHTGNKGLAKAFQSGINGCLQYGADIIVNTDGDNQYPGRYISDLVQPILQNKADMVIGERPIQDIPHFSRTKKLLQNVGSGVVRYVSGTSIPDAPSGFRALSREAALRLTILTNYTYTLETIIQASHKNLTVTSIPIQTNPKTRESRLIKSMSRYVLRSGATIIWLFLLYRPLRTFSYLALPFVLLGLTLWGRYGVLLVMGEGGRGANVQSITVGAALLIIGFMIFLIGLLGNLIAINRRLHEETLYHLKKLTVNSYRSEAHEHKETANG
ncbi:MAG: glycosyltransferase family 2 protein [Anaerolineales bacterium]|nr:glycosyltransferase family 2 protein [Anaerolineales bacterium]